MCSLYHFGYDLQGKKEILGIWLSEGESKNYWMQLFDELNAWEELKIYSLFPFYRVCQEKCVSPFKGCIDRDIYIQ